jgi:hypothetical protein
MIRGVGLVVTAVALAAGLAAPGPAQARQASATAGDAPGMLQAVTCTSTDNCWAVGGNTSTTPATLLVERWNGTAWQQADVPNPPKAVDIVLDGVACAMASDCWAVGQYQVGQAAVPLGERWNGTAWSQVAMPHPTEPRSSDLGILDAVSCPAVNFCVATGSYERPLHGRLAAAALLEVWNGTAWKIVTVPFVPTANIEILQAVSCASTKSCLATGAWTDYKDQEINPGGGLRMSWNGTTWTVASIEKSVLGGRDMYSVSCATSQMCMATGEDAQRQILTPWTQRWNGSTWTAAPFGLSETNQPVVMEVSCPASQMCMGAGRENKTGETLTVMWNGTSWSVVPSPNQANVSADQFLAVTCLSASYCWAVGNWQIVGSGNSTFGALTERWNGTKWALVNS